MSEKKPVKLDMYAAAKELGIDWDDLIKRVRADPPSSKEITKILNSRAYR